MIGSFLLISITGVLIYKNTKFSTPIRNLGWGIMFGSFTFLLFIVSLFIILGIGLLIQQSNG